MARSAIIRLSLQDASQIPTAIAPAKIVFLIHPFFATTAFLMPSLEKNASLVFLPIAQMVNYVTPITVHVQHVATGRLMMVRSATGSLSRPGVERMSTVVLILLISVHACHMGILKLGSIFNITLH